MRLRENNALVLTGGGARAAYQVGVLQAIREILPDPRKNPFPILCGTSAGAINAATLAVWARDFGTGVDHLHATWANFHAGQVYRADPLGIASSGLHWFGALMGGWFVRSSPRSLLDNTPLRELLSHSLNFNRIQEAIDSGDLHSISITCSGYSTGHSVAFFQGRQDLEPWKRTQRFGAHAKITVDHLLASSAIPFVFPAVHINREHFGDGSMRQLAPISPAVHLGAERVMVIGAGRMNADANRQRQESYPSLAQVAGHALASIFLDSLAGDLERLERVNNTIKLIPEEVRKEQGFALRPVESLLIAPSERLDVLAAKYAHELPWAVRALLRGIGAMNRRGGALTSYLLFERGFTQALIELGYNDSMARKDDILHFLCED